MEEQKTKETRLICRYCHQEIHAMFEILTTPIEIDYRRKIPIASEKFPFHPNCFCYWVVSRIDVIEEIHRQELYEKISKKETKKTN